MGANEFSQIRGIFEATALLTKGQQELEASHFETARQTYERALALMPGSIDALRGLGRALAGLQRMPEALLTLESALRLDTSDLLTRSLIGRSCLQMNQPQRAAEQFLEILKRVESCEGARTGLFEALIALGDVAGAHKLCEEVRHMDPKSPLADAYEARLGELERTASDTARPAQSDPAG